MTDMNDITAIDGLLYYDGTCAFCCRSIERVRPILTKRRVATVPFENGAAEPEMRLRWHDGREFGGADAAIFLASRIWWGWPFFAIAHFPGVRAILAAGYRRIAANRHCAKGQCMLPAARKAKPLWAGWTITAVLTAASLAAGFSLPTLPGMLWMWLLAGAMWLGFKIIAWTRQTGHVSPLFFLWVGMDAGSFASPRRETISEPVPYLPGIVGLAGGIALLAEAAPRAAHPVAAGWLMMTGLVCALHFGLFHLMAAVWQRLGFSVTPIMRDPWRAASLADLWGARWNRAFSDIARIAVFRPLVRRFGIVQGTLGGFLFSGLAHELVVSIPARAGYGLPTLYFLIQGMAVLLERRYPSLGRWFAWFIFLAPAGLLFHPPFMRMLTSFP
jgi:predicted DCC family thiol-disulfide oxidoreductase YuxK